MESNATSRAITASERTVNAPPAGEVRAQLASLLASEVFRTSKRCRAFLEFVVERCLDGRAAELREKLIGVEVFQRYPGYDSNDDPVVRATASDVRKRLAQYYQDPGRAAELRIEMQPGSYVPEFRVPSAAASPALTQGSSTSLEATFSLEAPPPAPQSPKLDRRNFWLAVGGCVAVGAAATWRWTRPGAASSPFEKFWAPLLGAPGSALICIGQSKLYNFPLSLTPEIERLLDPRNVREAGASADAGPRGTVALHDLQPVWDRYVPLGDAEALSRLAILFDRRAKAYRVRGSAHTSLADLREGSAVLVGAFSNDWALRISKGLRFRLARTKEDQRYVEDAEHPDFRAWMGATGNAFQGNSAGPDFLDYAIISRVFDSTTGTPIVSLGGITHLGTAEAGEFLTSPALMDEALKTLDSGLDWNRRNLQLVIETKVIGTSATPPRLLATHVW